MQNGELIVWALGIGLLQGFLHCSGMCGPFIMAFSLSRSAAENSDKRTIRTFLSTFVSGHLLHNLGRIITFVILGSIFGLMGSFVNMSSHLSGVQAAAGFIGGGLMILWALDELRTGHGGGRLEKWSLFRSRRLQGIMRNNLARQPIVSGMILGLHPCGLLFAILISAAASGSLWMGGATLLAFGIGTVPALLTVALIGWYGKKRITHKSFSWIAAGLIAASGLLFILRGMAVNGWIPGVSPWLF